MNLFSINRLATEIIQFYLDLLWVNQAASEVLVSVVAWKREGWKRVLDRLAFFSIFPLEFPIESVKHYELFLVAYANKFHKLELSQTQRLVETRINAL